MWKGESGRQPERRMKIEPRFEKYLSWLSIRAYPWLLRLPSEKPQTAWKNLCRRDGRRLAECRRFYEMLCHRRHGIYRRKSRSRIERARSSGQSADAIQQRCSRTTERGLRTRGRRCFGSRKASNRNARMRLVFSRGRKLSPLASRLCADVCRERRRNA